MIVKQLCSTLPPYYGNEKDYGKELFSRDEFTQMAELLKGIKGTFILSLNDRVEVREISKNFHIKGVDTVYTVSGGKRAKAAKELLISNKDIFS